LHGGRLTSIEGSTACTYRGAEGEGDEDAADGRSGAALSRHRLNDRARSCYWPCRAHVLPPVALIL
jgi:hypothetical protein